MAPRRKQGQDGSIFVVNEPGEISESVWNALRSHVSEVNAAATARLEEKLTKMVRDEIAVAEPPPSPPEASPGLAAAPAPSDVRVGSMVEYRLTVHDVGQIMARRKKREESGNAPVVGAKYPAVVVAVNGAGINNLRVFLDGEDSLWVKFRTHGDRAGNWS